MNIKDIKKETKNFWGAESKWKVTLNGIITINHWIKRQVLGHDSLCRETLNNSEY